MPPGHTPFGNDRSFPIRPHRLEHAPSGTPQERGGDVVSWVQAAPSHTQKPRGCSSPPHATEHPTPGRSSQTLLVLRGASVAQRSNMTGQRSLTRRVGVGWGLDTSSLHPISQHPNGQRGQRGQRGPRQWGWEGGKLEPAEKCVWLLLAPFVGAWPREPQAAVTHTHVPPLPRPLWGKDSTSESPRPFS